MVDEAHPYPRQNETEEELREAHMAVLATVVVAVGNWYHGVRTAEMNSAVVVARKMASTAASYKPAKFA